jgi:hypothetical protein
MSSASKKISTNRHKPAIALEIKLEEAYQEAAADKERTKEMDEWASLDIENWDE